MLNSGGLGHGKLSVILTDQNGEKRTINLGGNTLCQQFLNDVAAWSVGQNNTGQNAISPPTQFILGTGTGTVNVGDKALFTPATATQVSINTRSSSANIATFTTSYATGALNGTYTEAGMLDASGNLMAHIVFQTAVSVANTESASFIWTNTWNAG